MIIVDGSPHLINLGSATMVLKINISRICNNYFDDLANAKCTGCWR